MKKIIIFRRGMAVFVGGETSVGRSRKSQRRISGLEKDGLGGEVQEVGAHAYPVCI